MRDNRPSLTAQRVAMLRAAHQAFDEPKVLEDPIALRILGTRMQLEIFSGRKRFNELLARRLRAFVVARARVAEDALAEAVGRGVHQYVILGAGLDTFAYRSPYPASILRVFEVDHPTTQAWKRRQLAACDTNVPASLRFVAVDFESERMADRLREAGFQEDASAFFSCLGVTMYLTPAAVTGTLGYVASLPRGSGIVFDYAVSPKSVSLLRRLLVRMLMRRVAAIGEPWKTFFEPQALQAELRRLSFSYAEDLGPAELNARFFSNRTDELRVAGPGRVMSARV
jgi:methyltransferase (TIGR00027 family)